MAEYRRIEVVEAEPMSEFDFNMKAPLDVSAANVVRGRPSGSRAGYKVILEDGAWSWIEKKKFEREYQKI